MWYQVISTYMWNIKYDTTIQPLEFSRPEYWNGKPFLSPGDLPNLGLKLWSPALQVDSLLSEPEAKTGELTLLLGNCHLFSLSPPECFLLCPWQQEGPVHPTVHRLFVTSCSTLVAFRVCWPSFQKYEIGLWQLNNAYKSLNIRARTR